MILSCMAAFFTLNEKKLDYLPTEAIFGMTLYDVENFFS